VRITKLRLLLVINRGHKASSL